jgi:hypothetical protein
MTLPIQPNVDPMAPPVASPSGQQKTDDEIRQLATALAPEDPGPSLSGVKAIVTAVNLGGAGSRPSVTVTLGGVSVPDVAIASNYTPYVGDTVVLAKQMNSYVALFRISSESSKSTPTEGGWIQATLKSGHTHYDTNNPVMYRRVMNNGSWQMEWKGMFNKQAGNDDFLNAALATDYRPAAQRSMACGRSFLSGRSTLRLDAYVDGTLKFFGIDPAADPPWLAVDGVTYFL